jgi:hypothetical protein
MTPLRQRRQEGRRALVDGIEYEMPINSRRSPALMAGFSIDAAAARELLPGNEIHPVTLPGGRAILMITVIDYRETDIGKYIEFSIAIACTRGRREWPPVVAALVPPLFRTGQFVIDLPVSTEVSVKGGKGIWGMPKHQANLDFAIDDDTVSSTYDLDGRFCMKIEIDRPTMLKRFPLRASAVNYCAFRGMLMKSSIYFRGRASAAVGRWAGARLWLGDHPRMDALHTLDIADRPLFSTFIEDSSGILDDHYEGWFLTTDDAPEPIGDGLDSVADLGLGEEWLEPPEPRP